MDKTIEYSWTVPPGEPFSACWTERDFFDDVLRKYLPEPTHRSGSDQGTEITKVYSLDALTVFVIKNFLSISSFPRPLIRSKVVRIKVVKSGIPH